MGTCLLDGGRGRSLQIVSEMDKITNLAGIKTQMIHDLGSHMHGWDIVICSAGGCRMLREQKSLITCYRDH